MTCLTPGARAAPPAALELTCKACVLVDERGRVLWARRPGARLPNASTTKMVTALMVVRGTDPADEVTVSATAASVGAGGLDLQEGETFSVTELLYALLLTSSNDASVALAEHTSGDVDAFVARMNAYARRLGASDTHFVTPHGLDYPGHYSSAADLALLAGRLLRHPRLAAIVATPDTTVHGSAGPENLVNRNPLLEGYRGAVGVKTGFTAEAGNVLVAAAERHGRRLIAVAMGADDAARDDRRLLDYGWRRLRGTVLVDAGTPVGEVVLDPGGSSPVVPARDVTGIERAATVAHRFEVTTGLEAPVEPGDSVGRVVVTAAGRTVAVVDAIAVDAIESREPSWLTRALSGVLGAGYRIAAAAGATLR